MYVQNDWLRLFSIRVPKYIWKSLFAAKNAKRLKSTIKYYDVIFSCETRNEWLSYNNCHQRVRLFDDTNDEMDIFKTQKMVNNYFTRTPFIKLFTVTFACAFTNSFQTMGSSRGVLAIQPDCNYMNNDRWLSECHKWKSMSSLGLLQACLKSSPPSQSMSTSIF